MALLIVVKVILLLIIIGKKLYSWWEKQDSNPDTYSARTYTPESAKPIVKGKPFFNNAPKHWGTVTDEFLTSNTAFVAGQGSSKGGVNPKQMYMVNSLVLLGEINEGLQKVKGGNVPSSYGDALLESTEPYATTCCINKLFDKGIFTLNGIVVDNYRRYAIMLFDAPTPMAYINELREHCISNGFEDLIYFALQDPATVTDLKKVKFEIFNSSCFSFNAGKQGPEHRKYNEYAMWWAGELERTFEDSTVKDDIRIYLDLLDNHNSYALGILSYALKIQEDYSRVRMPDYDEMIVQGPEGVEILITLSRTKGINFHFPTLPRYERYRNNFIKTYVQFCYHIRSQIMEHDHPADEDACQPSTLNWYYQLLAHIRESGQNVAAVGVLGKVTNSNS